MGEDKIEHTPEGATVTLTLGEAFDLTVLRRQTAFMERAAARSFGTLMGHRREERQGPACDREVGGGRSGEWTILAESASHETETANRLVWMLDAARTAQPN